VGSTPKVIPWLQRARYRHAVSTCDLYVGEDALFKQGWLAGMIESRPDAAITWRTADVRSARPPSTRSLSPATDASINDYSHSDFAEAVVQTLIGTYHVAPARLTAKGIASLSPVASNSDDAGRSQNRRVELV
jgi:hypothetical protein